MVPFWELPGGVGVYVRSPTLVDKGLDDFYGCSYFFVCWTCSGLRANMVEEYVLLSTSSMVHAVLRVRTPVVDVPLITCTVPAAAD